jgi:phosphoribosyl-ATP pyrophosphohydrolase/phosphoribosyl-AMP cyclohydrolase/histidinol dehydrogenase
VTLLRQIGAAAIPQLRAGELFSDDLLAQTRLIIDAVRCEGEPALRRYGERFGELSPGEPLVIEKKALQQALRSLAKHERGLLERTAKRIAKFAGAQKNSLRPVAVPVPGGKAEQVIAPVASVGCYAPGGRYPLPSTVLMTAVTARVAGVESILVASPKPGAMTKAACAVAGCDALVVVGGAHAVAALTYGCGPIPAVDLIVGPGNKWVSAAKKLVTGAVGIDLLAGPTELVVAADRTADPALIAADLLAQAEHDTDASAILVTDDEKLIAAVEEELVRQLNELLTAATARQALERNGLAIIVKNRRELVAACDALAPEHLSVQTKDARALSRKFQHYGALFVGQASAEVLGDYGAGPNHVLPTERSARFSGGLSVFQFLRIRTLLEIREPRKAKALFADARMLAELEGLDAHGRSARLRQV